MISCWRLFSSTLRFFRGVFSPISCTLQSICSSILEVKITPKEIAFSYEFIDWIWVWNFYISLLASFQNFSLMFSDCLDFLSISLRIFSYYFSAFFFSKLNWWPKQTYSTQSARSIISSAYLELTEQCSNSGSVFNLSSLSYLSEERSLKFTFTNLKMKSSPSSCFRANFENRFQSNFSDYSA